MAKQPMGEHGYIPEKPIEKTKNTGAAPVKKKKNRAVYNVLLAVCILVFVGSVCVLGYQFFLYWQAGDVRDKLAELVPDATEEVAENGKKPLVDYSAVYAENPDFVGWLQIEGTKIDYPVVQGKDNDEYLYTNFYGKPHKLGTVFTDFRSTITADETSDNLVLYGHSAADGSYFGSVLKYKDIAYLKEHPFISFNTMYSADDWVVIGAVMIDALDSSENNFRYYDVIDFYSEDHYNQFMAEINSRNYFNTTVDCAYGDQFITLSTCAYDFEEARFVLFARKLREGETKESFNIAGITENEARKMP